MERVYWDNGHGFPVEADLEPYLQNFLRRGYQPYRNGDFSLAFGVSNGLSRQIDFMHRGRGRAGWPVCWEVLIYDSGTRIRLGPCFGLGESACIVVSGYDAVEQVANAWLGGSDLATLPATVDFYDRIGMTRLTFES